MMQKQQNRIDLAGSLVAIACAVHCIAIPVLVSLVGLGILNAISHGVVEITFLLATILFAGSSIFIGFRQKRISSLPIVLFAIGFLMICVSIIWHLHFLSAIGGICIATAHYFNWKYTKHAKATA